MKTALCFLHAARRAELEELRRLKRSTPLVAAVGALIHELQRERGLANRYLGLARARPEARPLDDRPVAGPPHADPPPTAAHPVQTARASWAQQVQASQAHEARAREAFDTTPPAQAGHGARLYARMAHALQGLDALPALRELIEQAVLDPRQATEAYARLIASLLAVVFEAADSATDPAISRVLVALFNLMQGKEWAGLERALGTALWASGSAEADTGQRLSELISSQDHCLRVAAQFSPPPLAEQLQPRAIAQRHTLLTHMRQQALARCEQPDSAPDEALSIQWFDCCTARIDHLHQLQTQLTQALQQLCEQRIAATEAELAHCPPWSGPISPSADAEPQPARPSANPLGFFNSAIPARAVQPTTAGEPHLSVSTSALQRSVLELVHQQSERLQRMEAELETVRASLNERKRIERAKGVLMAHRRLSEEEAHRHLRQTAMNQGRRLVEVADALLAMTDVLPPNAHP